MQKEPEFILSLDVSTSTIGIALFELETKKLVLLHHVSPKVKPLPDNKMEELFKKVEIFENEFLCNYYNFGIKKVVIEEPLLQSNNVYTITIGDSVSFIPTADVRWIDPTFQATECLVNRNQADRVAVYVAVSSKSILVKYQMPNGKVFHNRIFANNTYKAIKL